MKIFDIINQDDYNFESENRYKKLALEKMKLIQNRKETFKKEFKKMGQFLSLDEMEKLVVELLVKDAELYKKVTNSIREKKIKSLE